MRPWFVISLLTLALGVARAEDEVLFDFEGAMQASDWDPQGLRAARTKLPAEASPGPGVGNQVVRLTCGPKGGVFATALGKVEADWSGVAEVSFWVSRSKEARGEATTLEVFLTTGGQASFWRRVELRGAGWQQVIVPMKWFRWSRRAPRIDRVERFGIRFREGGELLLDRIAITRGPPGSGLISADDLREFFPRAEDVRVAVSDDLLLLTDAPRLDLEVLRKRLAKTRAEIIEDLPLEFPPPPPALLVFARSKDYQAFPQRMAARMNATSARPGSDGYTLRRFASSSWTERHGTERPVYVHEFAHALLAAAIGFGNGNEWLQEGLASRFQTRAYPQPDDARQLRNHMRDRRRQLPLKELCSGRPIPGRRYWQAMTVVNLLIEHPPYRERLGDLLRALRSVASTDLGPHLGPVLETDWAGFTETWRTFTREHSRSD